MDNENKDYQPQTSLPAGDQKTLQDEGIEILGKEDTTSDTVPAAIVKPYEVKRDPEKKQGFGTKPGDDIKALRTYKSDVEEAIADNRISAVKMVAAESERKSSAGPQAEETPSRTGRGVLFAAIGIILLAIAVGVGGYVFFKNQSPATTVSAGSSLPKPLVDVTSTQNLSIISGENTMSDFMTKVQALKIQSGLLSQIVPVAGNGIIIATSSDLFVALGVNVPEQILQSLDGTFTLGAYASQVNHPFLILGIQSFDNAFPGMLSWEKTMTTDLQFFIGIDHPNFTPGDTVPVFTDKIILNKDIRELDDASGTPELLYSFTDTHTLVITTDKDTMSQIITRLDSAEVTR